MEISEKGKTLASLSFENCKNKIWQLPGGQSSGTPRSGRSVRYEGWAGGSSSLLVLMKIHGISLTQLVFRVREPVVVHRPWFAARFNLQTKREGTVCVASIRWLCWSAASSPMSVPTTAKCACLFVYSYPRILVHGLILPGRRFVSHIFIPNISLSSFRFFFLFFFFSFFLLLFSLWGRRDRVFIISECGGEACNFTEFYRSNFISWIRGPESGFRDPRSNTVEIIAILRRMISCLFVLTGSNGK